MALPLVLALAFFSISFLVGLVLRVAPGVSILSLSSYVLHVHFNFPPPSLSLSEFFCARGRSMRNVFPKLDTQAYLEGCVGF